MKTYKTQRNFEKYTKAFQGHPQWGTYSIADLRKVFDAYHDQSHWKNAMSVTFDLTIPGARETANMLQAAIAFFHGERAKTTMHGRQAIVSSDGYAC